MAVPLHAKSVFFFAPHKSHRASSSETDTPTSERQWVPFCEASEGSACLCEPEWLEALKKIESLRVYRSVRCTLLGTSARLKSCVNLRRKTWPSAPLGPRPTKTSKQSVFSSINEVPRAWARIDSPFHASRSPRREEIEMSRPSGAERHHTGWHWLHRTRRGFHRHRVIAWHLSFFERHIFWKGMTFKDSKRQKREEASLPPYLSSSAAICECSQAQPSIRWWSVVDRIDISKTVLSASIT